MRTSGFSAAALAVFVFLLVVPPAAADHTNPNTPFVGAPTSGPVVPQGTLLTRGEGTWEHLFNAPGGAGNQLNGGGTDLEFFSLGTKLFGAFGTLGQDLGKSVGQRIFQLLNSGAVAPQWRADHGSARCDEPNPSTTGLQHDSQIATYNKVRLLTDNTDAAGRCHDTGGAGGIEIVDVSKIDKPSFVPREVHLVRLAGFSHTHTVDPRWPWIVYNSTSDFSSPPAGAWIDVLDLRSCFLTLTSHLQQRRDSCRPLIARIQFQPEWTQQRDQDTGQLEPGSSMCHDITAGSRRLFCASPNATVVIDKTGLIDANGNINGGAVACPVVNGTDTGAVVSNCSAITPPAATGWIEVGHFNHPGRDCLPKPVDNRNCNSNNFVRSDEGVSVAHEADPSHNEKLMFVTDERGGGVVPPGSSCQPGVDNPFGNGGAHAFNLNFRAANPAARIQYALTPSGDKAVYISDAVVPAPSFCDIHVIEHVPNEQRFIAAYYTQGIKIVDYFVDSQGRLQFLERASLTLPNANTWAAEDFKIETNVNPQGHVRYFIATDDIHRGVDVVSWTGPPNPIGAPPPVASSSTTALNVGLLGLAAVLLPAAAAIGRRRRRTEEVV